MDVVMKVSRMLNMRLIRTDHVTNFMIVTLVINNPCLPLALMFCAQLA